MLPSDPVVPDDSQSSPLSSPPDQLTIEFRPEAELVVVRWVGPCALERLREVYQRVGALLTRTRAHRVLFDTREREIIGEEGARWVATEAYATLLEGRESPLRLAYAVPEPVFKTFSAGPLETLSERLRVGVFLTPGSAIAWLLSS